MEEQYYWNLLGPKIWSNTMRNVMDMKANMGSFVTALKEKYVWVMNVVPRDGPNTLKLGELLGAPNIFAGAPNKFPKCRKYPYGIFGYK